MSATICRLQTEEVTCDVLLCDLGIGEFMVKIPFLEHGHVDCVNASTEVEAIEAVCRILRIRVPILFSNGVILPVSELPADTPEEFTRVSVTVQI